MQPSPQRETPRYVHFGVCGGCQQQHASVALQQESKARAEPWGYRRRARLVLQWQPRQQCLQMGFRQTASNDLVELTQCPVLVPKLDALLQPLHHCLSRLSAVKRLGHVKRVLVDNGLLMVLRHFDALSASDRAKLERFSHEHRLMT